jgi:hypothetical protein
MNFDPPAMGMFDIFKPRKTQHMPPTGWRTVHLKPSKNRVRKPIQVRTTIYVGDLEVPEEVFDGAEEQPANMTELALGWDYETEGWEDPELGGGARGLAEPDYELPAANMTSLDPADVFGAPLELTA